MKISRRNTLELWQAQHISFVRLVFALSRKYEMESTFIFTLEPSVSGVPTYINQLAAEVITAC